MHAGDSHSISPGPSPMLSLPRGRRILLVMAILSGNAGAALIYDALPPILADLAELFGGGSHGQFLAQLASTLPMFGIMLAGLFAGLAIARFGVRTVHVTALILFALLGSAGTVIDQPWLILLTRFAMGAAVGTMITSCTTLVADWFTGSERSRMNGWLVSSGSIAAIGFLFISGQVAGWWWRAPFLLHGLVAIIFLVPAMALPASPVGTPAILGTEPGHLARLKQLRPVTSIYIVALAMFVLMLLFNVQTTFLMAESGITSHGTVAAVFMLNAAMVTVASVSFGYVADRIAPVTAMRIVFVTIAASLLLVGGANAVWQFALAMGFSGLGVGMGLTTLWNWTMRRAAKDVVPHALGLMMTCMYLGGAISPFLLAPARAAFGLRGQYFAIAITVLVIVTLLTLVQRRREPVPAE